eukprot:6481547-Amphidinium_carterae.1
MQPCMDMFKAHARRETLHFAGNHGRLQGSKPETKTYMQSTIDICKAQDKPENLSRHLKGIDCQQSTIEFTTINQSNQQKNIHPTTNQQNRIHPTTSNNISINKP